MNLFLADQDLIKIDMPGRPSAGHLISQFVLALLGIEKELQKRGGDVMQQITEKQLKLAYFSADPQLVAHLASAPELQKIGIHLLPLGRKDHKNPTLIWVDLVALYDRFRIKKEFTMQDGIEFQFKTEETSIRAGADLK